MISLISTNIGSTESWSSPYVANETNSSDSLKSEIEVIGNLSSLHYSFLIHVYEEAHHSEYHLKTDVDCEENIILYLDLQL